MANKLTLSKSKINTFIECPRKFKYRYIDEITEEANKYMLLGTEVHEIAEEIAIELMEGNEIDDVFLNLEYDEKTIYVDWRNSSRTYIQMAMRSLALRSTLLMMRAI